MEIENNGAESAVITETPKNDYITTGPEDLIAPEKEEVEPAEVENNDSEQEQVKQKRSRGYKAKAERLEAELAKYRAKEQALAEPTGSSKVEAESAKPKPDDFEDYGEYTEALADWKVEQKLKERDKKTKEETQKAEFAKTHKEKVENYTNLVKEAQERYEDFDEVINEYDGPLTSAMQAALLDSDVGPDVAYYIATTEGEGERLAKLGIVALNKEIGKIEARLENRESKAVVKTTKAPPPLTPIGKGKSTVSKDPSNMTFEEYKVWRGIK